MCYQTNRCVCVYVCLYVCSYAYTLLVMTDFINCEIAGIVDLRLSLINYISKYSVNNFVLPEY